MRRPLLAAAALGLLAAAALAPIASAHSGSSGHQLKWVGRDGQSPLQEGDVVYGSDFLDLDVRQLGSDTVTSWKIEMIHEPSGAVSFCDGGNMGQDNMTLRCNWDTVHIGEMSDLEPGAKLSGASPAPNGSYLVKAEVWGQDCSILGCQDPESHLAEEFRLTVSNDLVKPAQPVSRVENGTIFVEWHRNPEPDAVTVLQERVNGGAWTDKGTDTHFQRAGDPGVYEYRAVANRPNSNQIASDVTPAFEISAPPPGAAPGDPGIVSPAPTTPPTSGTTATTAKPKTGTSTRPRGTEQSRGLSGSTMFTKPTVRKAPPSTTVTTADDGFEETLTYPTQPPKMVEMPGEEVAVEKLITEERPIDVRGILVPLAGGLAVFIFAMQMTFIARRRPSIATGSEDDWA
jgi:hypothetical protein